MKRFLPAALLVLSALLRPLAAGELPAMFEKPFLGCFMGYAESRDFDFALGADGSSELFFKDSGERLSLHGATIKFNYLLEERPKGKERWISRQMQEDGFETSFEATAAPPVDKPITFTATYTGDTKVEITHVFTRDGLLIRSRIVDQKTDGEVRAGVKITIGDLYRHIKEELEERDLKDKVEGSELRVWPVGGRSSSGDKVEFYDGITLQEEFPKGARRFSLESDRIDDKEITFSTRNEDYGHLEFRQTRDLFHGFPVVWFPDPEKVAEKDCHLVVEVK